MNEEIGSYSFFPWLRQGITNNVRTPNDPSAKRGELTVSLRVDGRGVEGGDDVSAVVNKRVELYGPGDVVAIDRRAIVKNEPDEGIENFEPNYLPYVDFADGDFLWRYTPSAADGDRLAPWLTLIVLRTDEFSKVTTDSQRPLPYITIKEDLNLDNIFPPADDLWAWAHVHVNKDLVGEGHDSVSNNQGEIIGGLNQALAQNPDLVYSRLLSSRKLAENTRYHAFVIPSFEAGRLAGLGLDPDQNDRYGANTIAWQDYQARQLPREFPVYHSWSFATSSLGDFEYLLRLLKPKTADARVGRRDIDVLEPGANIQGIDDERLAGILRLGGALRFPLACLDEQQAQDHQTYDNWWGEYPHRFQQELAGFINLADDYQRKSVAAAHQDAALDVEDDDVDPDPLVTPTLYGKWHGMTNRVLNNEQNNPLPNNQNWLHELNLDPRWRSAANFGTQVIQLNQEQYMDAAWSQVGEIMEANRRFERGRMAQVVSEIWYRDNIVAKDGVSAERYLQRTAPMHKRILSGGQTAYYATESSNVPHALISPPMRRIARPGGPLMKRLEFTEQQRPDNWVERTNQGEVDIAPQRELAENLPSHEEIAQQVRPSPLPAWLERKLERYAWAVWCPLYIALLMVAILLSLNEKVSQGLIAIIVVIGYLLSLWLQRYLRLKRAADVILPENQTPEELAQWPGSPNFEITASGADNPNFSVGFGRDDSDEAQRFKDGLNVNFDYVVKCREAGKVPEYEPLDIPGLLADTENALNPRLTIPRYLFGQIKIPEHIINGLPEQFVAAMAYPVIDVPMYKPLLESGTDNFIPNLNLIEQNSITLLETNQRFIEAYMVGINHEFVRELQWRGFPTDMRGTSFRQFWDVSSVLNRQDMADEQWRERLRDIPPLHLWSRASVLGDHDHREEQGDKENEVVLVIRGELLQKYPNAVIYAQRAKWPTTDLGERDLRAPREFEDSGDPQDNIKTPIYEAKADPDITFIGFDLTVTEAKGGSGEDPDDSAGWFFVIKERPGEPRFGLDVPGDEDDYQINVVDSWNDLSWSHVVENAVADQYLSPGDGRTIRVESPAGEEPPGGEAQLAWQQKSEDAHVGWNRNTNSARLAYILYQVPVLVGVHAAEMLPDACDNENEQ